MDYVILYKNEIFFAIIGLILYLFWWKLKWLFSRVDINQKINNLTTKDRKHKELYQQIWKLGIAVISWNLYRELGNLNDFTIDNKKYFSENILWICTEIKLFYENFDKLKNNQERFLEQMKKNQLLIEKFKKITFEETNFDEVLFRKTIIK